MTEQEMPIIFQKKQTRKIDAEVLSDKVSAALADLTESYIVQVKQDIQVMQDLLKQAETASPQKKFNLIREDFFVKMHDLKGQGTTFGYPLLTEIGAVVCDFLRERKNFSLLDISYLKQYVDDAAVIVQKNLTGDGGKAAAAIRTRLDEAKNA